MKTLLALMAVAVLLLGCISAEKYGREEAKVNAQKGADESGANETGGNGMIAENGDTVAVDYLGTLENGTVFDTSVREEAVKANLPLRPAYSPLEFKVGAGQMISGFDKAVLGMKIGEEKTATLQPGEAYGEWSAEKVVALPKENLPDGTVLGSRLSSTSGMSGRVVEINETSAKIDFNHELAGKPLTFRITMRGITKGG